MKNKLIVMVLLIAGLIYLGCKSDRADDVDVNVTSSDTTKMMAETTMSLQDSVERGKYLTLIMGCSDCHTPKRMTDHGPEPNPDMLFSGHPAGETLPAVDKKALAAGWMLFSPGLTSYVGPWGQSFAANLTPDVTGLGNWTYANFEKAIREGKFKGLDGGRMILPPMPWPMYANLTDEDLQSMWKYLRTVKPISNVVPAALPPS